MTPETREREAALRLFADFFPTIVWTTDEDLRVTAAFGEGISGLEVHPRELIGLMIDEILGHDPAAPAVAAHERALRGAPDTYLQEFMGRTFQCRVEPLRQAGRGDGVIGVALDITERAEAERRVMEAELRYRSLVEQVPAVVYSSPARGRDAPEFASPQIEDLLGRSPDEWARDPELWRRSIHPEDRERVAAEWEKAVAGEGAFESEYRMIHADGRVVWVRDQSRLVRDSERRALGWQGVFTDITRARRREQQLRRTNQALRALIEASPLAIAAVDLDGNVTLWNPAAERLFGWTEGDVVGKPIPTIPSRVREEWTVVLDSGSQGAVVSTPETRCLRKDGSEISVEISRAPIRDASGEIVGIFGIFTDITERKRAEQALRASEERYRGLFENALDVVFTTDLTGRFTAVNRAAKRVSGYSRKELLRMNIIDLVASEHRDVVQRVLDLTPPVAQAADAPRARTRYELDIVTKEGRRRSLEAVIHLVWEGDEPVAVEGIARDVTDRKHAEEALRASEERYRELFENARDIIYTHDLEGRITSVNRAAERIAGLPKERLVGVSMWNLLAPDHLAVAQEMLRRKLEGGGPTRYEIDAVDRRGRRVPLEVSARLIYEDGRAVGVQGIARDISERRRAQEALQRSERQFRSLIENALDVIAVLDDDITFRYGSPSLHRVLGYEPDELVGRPVTDILHPDDVALVEEALERGLQTPGEAVGLEVRARHRDGTWRVVEGIGVNLIDDPDIRGIVVNARDITERKRSEEGLRFLVRASESLASSLDINDTLGQLAMLTARALCDWCVVDVLGEDGSDPRRVVAHRDPGRQRHAEELAARHLADPESAPWIRNAVLDGRSSVTLETPRDEDRRILHALGAAAAITVPLAGRDRIIGAITLVAEEQELPYGDQDVTLAQELGRRAAVALESARLFNAARENEARFRQLVEGVQDYALFRLDADGRIESWQPTAERIFGYREEEIVGDSVSRLYPEHGPGGPREIAAARVLREAAEHGTHEEEGWRVRKDGTRLWVVSGTTALRDADGRLTGFSRITRDVTARKEAERELERTLAALRKTDHERRRVVARLVEAQEEERERIAADIHDDSLQVMVAVGMRLEMLERTIGDPEARDDLDQLRRVVADSVRRLRLLLFDVRPPVLDTEGLEAALRLYANQMRVEMGFAPEISSHLDEEPPAEIATIAYRIAAEALQNAKKHARATRVEIMLDTRDDGILVRVSDDGVGFSRPDVDARLPGHLGLVTMRERAEVAGGWFRLDSAPGRGTTVGFWLPVPGTDISRAS